MQDLLKIVQSDIEEHIKEFDGKETSLKFSTTFSVKGKFSKNNRCKSVLLTVSYWEEHHSEEYGEGINLVTKIISYTGSKGKYVRNISYDKTPVYKKWYDGSVDEFKF